MLLNFFAFCVIPTAATLNTQSERATDRKRERKSGKRAKYPPRNGFNDEISKRIPVILKASVKWVYGVCALL